MTRRPLNPLTSLLTVLLLALSSVFVPALAANTGPLAVITPDGLSTSDPRLAAWRDAAAEEGLQLVFITDSQFLAAGTALNRYSGLILPDQVHTRADDTLIQALQSYVNGGGNLMVVYDAASLTADGFYPSPRSRLSDLVGVDYVLYDELRDFTIGLGPVVGTEQQLWAMQVPPGKSAPFAADAEPLINYIASNSTDPGGVTAFDLSKHHKREYERRKLNKYSSDRDERVRSGWHVEHGKYDPRRTRSTYEYSRSDRYDSDERDDERDESDDERDDDRYHYSYSSWTTPPAQVEPSTDLFGVTGYVYGFLDYPTFVTRGEYDGTVLLSSPDYGLAAGVRNVGAGRVMFVNLPLSYLKGQTDGMLMHGMLRYFGSDLLEMPRLAGQPGGVGGLILNWHVDAGDAIPALAKLYPLGVWDHGPYSIHFTAGPDTIVPGDGLGMDVPNNRYAKAWIRYLDYIGHAIGSHGGWIHDYYGTNANETNRDEFLPYLVLNKKALEDVIGHRVREYSAPQGNNPLWAMDWLSDNGFSSYYFTGHTGMGPTRGYRDGKLMYPDMWAMPVSTLDKYATFEEFDEFGVTDAEVMRWLDALTDFTINNHTSRLIYFHPPGAVEHPEVMTHLMDRTRDYEQLRRFRWYTMDQMARFQTSRSKVSWTATTTGSGGIRISASHPESLRRQTWLLPRDMYTKPYVTSGYGRVRADDKNWIVTARYGRSMTFVAGPR